MLVREDTNQGLGEYPACLTGNDSSYFQPSTIGAALPHGPEFVFLI
jgi:hypothetical protein